MEGNEGNEVPRLREQDLGPPVGYSLERLAGGWGAAVLGSRTSTGICKASSPHESAAQSGSGGWDPAQHSRHVYLPRAGVLPARQEFS